MRYYLPRTRIDLLLPGPKVQHSFYGNPRNWRFLPSHGFLDNNDVRLDSRAKPILYYPRYNHYLQRLYLRSIRQPPLCCPDSPSDDLNSTLHTSPFRTHRTRNIRLLPLHNGTPRRQALLQIFRKTKLGSMICYNVHNCTILLCATHQRPDRKEGRKHAITQPIHITPAESAHCSHAHRAPQSSQDG